MTREQTKALLPVLVAWGRGEAIQVRVKDRIVDNPWETYRPGEEKACADFLNQNWEWRVKPTPREFWILQEEDGHQTVMDKHPKLWPTTTQLIHVREVVE